MTALVVIEAVAIGVLALLVVGLLRSHAEILRALHSLGIGEEDLMGEVLPEDPVPAGRGTPAHDVVGTTPDGGAVKAAVVGTGRATLLAFLSSGCAGCERLWSQPSAAELDLPGDGSRVVVVTKGVDAESPAAVARLAPPGVQVVMSSEAFADYQVPATPYFVLVDGGTGRVAGEGSAGSWRQVSNLVRRAAGDAAVASRRRRHLARVQDTDEELAAAGIEPGDPNLYPGRRTG